MHLALDDFSFLSMTYGPILTQEEMEAYKYTHSKPGKYTAGTFVHSGSII